MSFILSKSLYKSGGIAMSSGDMVRHVSDISDHRVCLACTGSLWHGAKHMGSTCLDNRTVSQRFFATGKLALYEMMPRKPQIFPVLARHLECEIRERRSPPRTPISRWLFASWHSYSAGSHIRISRITSSDSTDNTEQYTPGSWVI